MNNNIILEGKLSVMSGAHHGAYNKENSFQHRVLITGGAGFIGTRLAWRLSQVGVAVSIYDNFTSPSTYPFPENARLFLGDVRDTERLRQVAKGHDVIINLASLVGVDRVSNQPIQTRSVIIDGIKSVAQVARELLHHVIFFSSSEVTDNPRSGPRNIYGQSKKQAEDIIVGQSEYFPVTVIRPFNVVGAGQSADHGMVLPTFVRSAITDSPIPVHGDGSQKRSFLHVDDLIDAMLTLLSMPDSGAGEIYEIGSSEAISVLEVASLIVSLTGSKSDIKFSTDSVLREDKPRRMADISVLRRKIDFCAKRDIGAIVTEIVEFERGRLCQS